MKRTGVLLVVLIAVGCTVPALPPQGAITALPTATRALEPTAPVSEPVAPAPASGVPSGMVWGVVQDAEGPVTSATVRVQATDNKTTTADDGSFTLSSVTATEPFTVTAWAEGYYVGWAGAVSGEEPITITLKPYYTTDNMEYEWFSFQGVRGSKSCSVCHPAYPEWRTDAHSQTAINPRFLTMYEGTDVHGNRSPLTRFSSDGAEPPDPTRPYYGPGFKLDSPDRAGNCAACHTPLASSLPTDNTCGWLGCHTDVRAEQSKSLSQEQIPEGIDPTGLTGIAAEGISCEFCHKIGDVILNPETGLPYTDRPGILSMRLYRPDEGQQLFFGPFDDVTRRVSYLPLEQESAFCAPCHYGVFSAVDGMYGGVVGYNSFGEWLESPYSDPETGKTCQDCHMSTVDYDYFVFPEEGGLHRDPDRIHSHLMPGARDETLLRNSVTMTTTAQLEGDVVLVEVSITNDKAGHYVPTGVPLRHLILVVQATDAAGDPLPLREGPVLPDWTGNYAGRPGRYYAKVLEDKWTGESPTAAYWREIRLVEDTRIAAFATDVSRYAFAAPANGPVTIEARLIYRRAFQQLMEWKGWDDPDIVMEEEAAVVAAP